MIPPLRQTLQILAAVAGGLTLQPVSAQIEPAATAVLKAASGKLATAQTLRVHARHTLDPALGIGRNVEKANLDVTVARPNKFFALQTGDSVREIAYDGRTLCLIDPVMDHHVIETIKAGTVEGFADQVDKRFGFRPPLAELLASDVHRELLLHVTTARVIGRERVGWTPCQRVQLVQAGQTTDLWIGVGDSLPRRMRMTFTGLAGSPTWDVRFSKWELNPALPASRVQLFSKRPGPGSQRLIPVRRN